MGVGDDEAKVLEGTTANMAASYETTVEELVKAFAMLHDLSFEQYEMLLAQQKGELQLARLTDAQMESRARTLRLHKEQV